MNVLTDHSTANDQGTKGNVTQTMLQGLAAGLGISSLVKTYRCVHADYLPGLLQSQAIFSP